MATTINDLILTYIEGSPAFFGRIEDIIPDIKPGWWHVHIMILNIPPQMITWILDDSQINGKSFTMSGIPVRIEKVESPYIKEEIKTHDKISSSKIISFRKEGKEKIDIKDEASEEEKKSKVISLMDRIKKD